MLKGESVALTALAVEDLPDLLRWINDPETVRLSSAYEPVHAAGHSAWFERTTTDPSRIIFAIRSLATSRMIGVLQLIDIHPVHRSAELLIRIGDPEERGRGAGTDAVRLAVQFAFRDRNLQRVWLRVVADNARAVRSYEKAGLVTEGMMRRAAFVEGRWADLLVMAILAESGPQPDAHVR